MCKKYATLLCFLCALVVFSPRVSAQDTTSGDSQIVANQQAILSILPVLIESSLSREADLSKREQISNERDAELTQKENDLSKKEQSISERESELLQSDKDMQTLKDTVKTQSELLSKEQHSRSILERVAIGLGSALGVSIAVNITQSIN